MEGGGTGLKRETDVGAEGRENEWLPGEKEEKNRVSRGFSFLGGGGGVPEEGWLRRRETHFTIIFLIPGMTSIRFALLIMNCSFLFLIVHGS